MNRVALIVINKLEPGGKGNGTLEGISKKGSPEKLSFKQYAPVLFVSVKTVRASKAAGSL